MLRRTALFSLPLGALSGKLHAQNLPVIGFLSSRTPAQARLLVEVFKQGLEQEGFREGSNVAIEYRWANGNMAALPGLAANLVKLNVAVVVAGGTAQAAKESISTIPVVFTTGLDPVSYGLVANLNRPSGNLTGATFYSGALGGKQLELLRELAPKTRTFGLLVKPDSAAAQPQIDAMRNAVQAAGIQVQVVKAAIEADFEPAIAAFANQPDPGLIVSVDPYFDSRAKALVAAVNRHALPAIYNLRIYVDAGGLISYGASINHTYRQAGIYAGRILKGAKPADLPVIQPTRFELIVNSRTATSLGLTLGPALLARADEVLE